MILLIAGSTHTGKTALAQRLLERYHVPYLSLDHLKMGLIRSGMTELTVSDDEALTELMWPMVREMIKTAIENRQHLIIEGCYLPFDWLQDFGPEYRSEIRFVCLVMTDRYIQEHFDDILAHESVIEQRLDDGWCTRELLLEENRKNLALCKQHRCEMLLIDEGYQVDLELF